MSIVVEPTLPFPPTSLDLQNPHRWNTLFPLLRPTVQTFRTAKGQHVLIDTALAHSPHVHIVAVGKLGNFSSKLLDDRHVTAIMTETAGGGILTTQDLPHTLLTAGVEVGQGVVVVRAGREREVLLHGPEVLEIETRGELEQDHVLHLLGNAIGGCRASVHQIAEMLKGFVLGVGTAHVRFHTEKAGSNPTVLHDGDLAEYSQAKQAVERALKTAMSALTAAEGDVVYSVHFSDLNGLSRLENYIIAGEIGQYFESQNLPCHLSHSTILNHEDLARGWSLSVCPVPSHYLFAQAKPTRHTLAPAQENAQAKNPLQPFASQIHFADASVRKRIESGCNAVIAAEATITEYDTIVGDGDCGYTLRDGAKQVLAFLAGRDLFHLPEAVGDLVRELEMSMGGTSGALYCIFLTALASSLASEASVPEALGKALEQLMQYTKARVGDRTMMDTLIPFVETLARIGGDAEQALGKAREGMVGTEKMEAKLGRSTYLDESATRGVPDPGAYGLLVLLEGMCLV